MGRSAGIGVLQLSADERAALISIRSEVERWASTAQETVLETLRRGILVGVLRPGVRLQQEQFAEILGTSRLPVREAIWILEREGLLSAQNSRTVMVTRLDPAEIVEIYDLRVVCECRALEIAVPLLTEADLDELHALYAATLAVEDPMQLVVLRDRFYARLFQVSGNRRLVNLILRLRQEIWRTFHGNPPSHPGFHERLFAAVLAGDVEAAKHEIATHYAKVSAMLRRTLRDGDGLGETPWHS